MSFLAVIDMQVIFADPDSAWAAPRFDEVIEPVTQLVEAFGDRSVFTRFVAPEQPSGPWVSYYADWPFALQPADAPIYQLIAQFSALAGATVDATTFGKWTPELAGRVGDGPLVVCGVATDCCVLSTVLAAVDAGVAVEVVSDACAGVNDTSHEQALAVMAMYGPLVRIRTCADVLAELACSS